MEKTTITRLVLCFAIITTGLAILTQPQNQVIFYIGCLLLCFGAFFMLFIGMDHVIALNFSPLKQDSLDRSTFDDKKSKWLRYALYIQRGLLCLCLGFLLLGGDFQFFAFIIGILQILTLIISKRVLNRLYEG